MSFRHSLALNVTPLILRLGLAATFLWAGWGKVLETRDYKPEELARLATMGVEKAQLAARGSAASARPAQPSREIEADRRAPSDSGPAAPLPDPATPKPNKSSSGSGGGGKYQPMHPAAAVSAEPAEEAKATPPEPAAPRRVYTAGDFDGPAQLKKVYSIALLIDARSKPAPAADGKQVGALWPAEWAKGLWPVYFAWSAGIAELLGGGLILIGLAARLTALSLAGVMVVAAWLTSVGPNLGSGFLGFAPPWSSFVDWTTFLFQVMSFCAAMGVFFSGAGAVSLDQWVFGREKPSSAGDDEE